MRQYVTLEVPLTQNRFARMYSTARNVAGSSAESVWIRWKFFSPLERNKAYRYLKYQFEYRENLEVEQEGPASLVMRYRRSVCESPDSTGRPPQI